MIIKTRPQFEIVLDRTVVLLNEREAQRAARAEAVQAVEARFQATLKDLDAQIDTGLQALETFTRDHEPELLPGQSRSTILGIAKFGFRTGQPTVKPKRKWTWERVMESIRTSDRTDLIRVKEEPDKEALRALPEEELDALGLRLEQVERFFVEPTDPIAPAERVTGAPTKV